MRPAGGTGRMEMEGSNNHKTEGRGGRNVTGPGIYRHRVCVLLPCCQGCVELSVSTGDFSFLLSPDRLAGLVVKASASGAEDPGFESRLRRNFSGSSHTSLLKIGTPVATLPYA